MLIEDIGAALNSAARVTSAQGATTDSGVSTYARAARAQSALATARATTEFLEMAYARVTRTILVVSGQVWPATSASQGTTASHASHSVCAPPRVYVPMGFSVMERASVAKAGFLLIVTPVIQLSRLVPILLCVPALQATAITMVTVLAFRGRSRVSVHASNTLPA